MEIYLFYEWTATKDETIANRSYSNITFAFTSRTQSDYTVVCSRVQLEN